MGYIRGRLDKIAEKLQIADAGPNIARDSNIRATTGSNEAPPTREQVGKLCEVVKSRNVRTSNAMLSAGERVPNSVSISALPSDAENINPKWKSLSYTVTKGGIALVDSKTKKVIRVLPDPGR